ncbi:hypothetical protein FIBSPDRAFT_740141, partial [Athelia psychrophila]
MYDTLVQKPVLPRLRIVNCNVNKSIDAQTDLLQRMDPEEWDVICIQEPCFDWRDTTRATQKWSVVYPRGHNNKVKRTRSLILVNTMLPTTSWKALAVDSADVVGIQMVGEYGAIRIFSIYNNQEDDASM